jgi:cytochrome c oxidase cbb3-type subunit 3
LTDKFWLHGHGTRVDVIAVIRKGVPDKGMPPWETMLKPDELKSTVAFVFSIKDSNPANAKAPQGNPE